MPSLSGNILDRRRFATVVAGGLAIAGLPLLPPRPARAADAAPDVYTAEAVPVDVTSATVNDARDRGLVQGRVNGLRKVLERLVSRDDLARVPTLNSTQIIEMVRDFSIANERSSAVRYIAELTVRYNPEAVRRLLRGAGIPFAETVSKPLVVVPVMATGARNLLWEESNPWRLAWNKVASPNGLVPIFVPAAEPKDISALSVEQALAKDPSALGLLANAYDAGGALVAVANVSGRDILVSLTAVRPGLPNQELSAAGSPEGSLDDQLASAARAAIAAVQDDWRERNTVTGNAIGQITALVSIENLKDWLAVRDRLTNVSLIQKVEMQAITRDRAQVTLYYAGGQDQLRLAMSQRDLSLAQQGGVWVISVARR